MRKENAGFRTTFLSEEGSKLLNRDYFAYIELDNFACYVAADSLDEEKSNNSAEIAVKCVLREFEEHPSMASFFVKRNLRKAHKELLANNEGMRLRASIAVIVTDYIKFRYASVGNTRASLIRNDRILYGSKDQSLTENLVEEEAIPRDKAALHEERNNLYSYLGQRDRRPDIQICKKRRLANGDILLLYTRGIWENCDTANLLECAKDTATPEDMADNVEEFILGKKQPEVDNYTIAVTFVDKVYIAPKRRGSLKKLLAILIPILVILLALGITLFVRHRIRMGKIADMEQFIVSGREYISHNNYERAVEEYRQAEELAGTLKLKDDKEEIDTLLLLAEQIMLADSALEEGDYEKAEELYYDARKLSEQAGGIAGDYLTKQQDKVSRYLEIFELLESGELKEEYGDYAGAIESYKKAKAQAVALYDKELRAEALEKQRAAEESLEKLRQAELAELEANIQAAIEKEQVALDLENQSLMNDKQNALELETKGNELMKNEDYVSAIAYFETAMGMYENLEMPERVRSLEAQIKACKKLDEEAKRKAQEEAQQKSDEEAAAEEAKAAAEEARQAIQDLKDAQKDAAIQDALKAAEEAKQAAEEAKKAAEGKKDGEDDEDAENGEDSTGQGNAGAGG